MKRVALVLAVVVAVGAAGLWFWHSRAEKPAPPVVTSGSVRIPVNVPVAANGPARAEVVVSDAKGPIAGAVVRLVAEDNTIEVVTTTADGVAHAEVAPSTYTISASAVGHLPNAAAPRKISSGETANVALVLATGGHPVTGQVTDATGGPVAGARVDAALLGAHARAGTAVAVGFTEKDGHYKLTIGGGEATVAVNHPDYAAQQRYVEISDTGAVANFQLVPGGVIEGVVRDAETHATVGGARVDVQRDRTSLLGELSSHHVTADSDGKFRITGLRPGAYALHAESNERYSPAPTIVGLGVAEQVGGVVLLVGHGARIRGTVVDEHDQPVGNLDVRIEGGRGNETKSDAKGAFVIGGLGPNKYSLQAEGGDYVWMASTPVEVGVADVDGVVVRVVHAIHMKGHVEPREVCDIDLAIGEGGRHYPSEHGVHTGDDGAFEFASIRSLAYVASARCPNGDEGSANVVAGTAEITISVKPGGTIHGRVVDGKGTPIANARVNAGSGHRTEITNGMVTSGAAAVTSATGEFDLTGLAASDYLLSVLDRGRPVPMKSKATAKVALAAGEHKTGVELVVDRPDGVIQGVVTGPDGQPLADAWVSVEQNFEDMISAMMAEQQEAGSKELSVEASDDGGDGNSIAPVLTDANGHFIITGLPRIPWAVTAEAQAGKLRGRVEKVKPDATITIPIASVRTLSGTVHVTGTPPTWFSVELEGPTNAQRSFAWTDGTFSFERVDPGNYTVTAASSVGTAEAKLVVGADNAHVDLTLAIGATISGKLVDKDGKPVADVGVVVVAGTSDGGDGKMNIKITNQPESSGPDGTFKVDTKPGKVILVILTGGGAPTTRRLTITDGQALDAGTITIGAPEKP